MLRPLRNAIVALGVAAALIGAGIWLGGHPAKLPAFIADSLVDDRTQLLDEALGTVQDTYYRSLSDATLSDYAIGGMVDKLNDRFSTYFTPKQYREFQRTQRSEFSGIGVLVTDHPLGLRVLRVYDDSPAKRGGVRIGDVIVAADGKRLKGLTRDAASERVSGPPGSDVRVTLRRDHKQHTVTITRATVSAGFTASRLVKKDDERVGVVALSQFGPGAHGDLRNALQRLRQRGATRYILDLRGNGGGLVSESQLVASLFLKGGAIVTTKGRSVPSRTLDAVGDPLLPSARLVVLVDRDTASASEIVSGALQDRKRATVVGTRTFGKGVFQEVIRLSNGGALDITAGQYFTPSGRNLGGKGVQTGAGITPDLPGKDDPKTRPDEGLDAALAAVVDKTP